MYLSLTAIYEIQKIFLPSPCSTDGYDCFSITLAFHYIQSAGVIVLLLAGCVLNDWNLLPSVLWKKYSVVESVLFTSPDFGFELDTSNLRVRLFHQLFEMQLF